MTVDSVLVLLCFLVALAFPVIYWRGRWWDYIAGRSLMNLSVVIVLALGLAVARQFLGDDYPHREAVRSGVFALILGALTSQLVVLLHIRRTDRRAERYPVDGMHDDDLTDAKG